MSLIKFKLGDLIQLVDERNSALKYDLDSVRGISIQKIFIPTKADMEGVSLRPYILVEPNSFAYVPVTSRNGEKITIAHNITEKTFIVSLSYIVFKVCREEILLSDYLFMFFNRPEFDRYARFNSWGSAREIFSWSEMCDIEIELPPLEVQKKFVAVYNSMLANQKIFERGLDDLKLVCDGYILQKNFHSVILFVNEMKDILEMKIYLYVVFLVMELCLQKNIVRQRIKFFIKMILFLIPREWN